jgi:hypothetical protein
MVGIFRCHARLIRLAGALTITAAMLAVSGCGQQPNLGGPVDPSIMKARFANGDAIMSCGLGCSFSYGSHRQDLRGDYDNGNWDGLADRLLTIGYDIDQSWYYLGSAAEGLGYDEAAQHYYFASISSRLRCKGVLNVCDGFDLPALTFQRLNELDAKILASPQFAQLAAPPPPPGRPANIRLVDDHGTLLAPVLLDGKVPLLLAVDSGDSFVTIPPGLAIMLTRTGVLKKADILGLGRVTLGDGSTVPVIGFKIRRLQVGNLVLTDVTGTFSAGPGELLLGQSVLSRFKSWSIDNSQHLLILQQP